MRIRKQDKIISLILKAVVVLAAAAGVYLSASAGRYSFMGGSRVFMYFTIQSNIATAAVCLIGAFLLMRKGAVVGGSGDADGTPNDADRMLNDADGVFNDAGGVPNDAGGMPDDPSVLPASSAASGGMNLWLVIKFVCTVSITLTGAVFSFVLAPTLGDAAWNLPNVLTHVVVPVASIIDFFVTGRYGEIRKSSVLFATIPPIAYAIYAGIGYILGWEFGEGIHYPYFFLNWGSPAGAFGFTDELPFMGCAWWILALSIALVTVGYIYLVILDKLKVVNVEK